MHLTTTKHVQLFWKGALDVTFFDPESKLQFVGYLGSYDSLSVLVLREVRQKGMQPYHISFSLKKHFFFKSMWFSLSFKALKFVLYSYLKRISVLKCWTNFCSVLPDLHIIYWN